MAVRLWAGLALFAVLLFTAAGFIHDGLAQQDRSVDGLVGRLHPLEIANLEVRADFAQAQSVLRAYVLTREARFLSQYRLDKVALARAFGQARDHAADGELAGIAAENRAALTWLRYAGQMESRRAGSPALTQLTNQASDSAQNFYRASDRLQTRLEADGAAAVSSGAQAVDNAVTVASVFATVAALLGLVTALAIILGVTGPMRGLVAILRRLTAGDHGARAPVAGPTEMREVAESLNALADESDRLRAQEAETSRLRATARETGLRIREHLRVEDLLHEAKDAIESGFGADIAYLHIKRDGELGLPVGHEHDWLLRDSFSPSCGVRARPGSVTCSSAMRAWCTRTSRALRATRCHPMSGTSCARRGWSPSCLSRSGPARNCWASSWPSGRASDGRGPKPRRARWSPWPPTWAAACTKPASIEAENRLVDELRAVDQIKSDFLATVSHELRTPLTSIAGYIEVLRERDAGPLTPAQDRMLDAVDRNTARLRHLIEDVLTLSKIESGAFTSTRQPVSLTEIVTADITALRPAAAAKGLVINWEDSRAQADGQR